MANRYLNSSGHYSDLTVGYGEFQKTLENALDTYCDEIIGELKSCIDDFTDELVEETKKTAPRGRRNKHYYKDITSKTARDTRTSYRKIWYVKGPNARITHLIEKGHETKNGGRTKAYHFVQNAYNKLEPGFLERLNEIMSRD